MFALALSPGTHRLIALWVVLAFAALPSSEGFGETFDVPGTRAQTIGQALSLAQLNSDSSNIIEVASGNYTETTLTISKSVTIRGKDGAKVVVRAANDPLVVIGGTSTVTLANLILITSGTAIRIDSTATVVLRNLVITRASTAIVCPSTGTTTASIDHVTFFQVTNGINCQTSRIPIRNNIFSVVSGTPISPFTVVGATRPNFNLFHAATGPTGERGDNAFPNATDTADDPKFVDSADNDFHLQDGSVAIDKGVNLANEPVDLGAYGGVLADQRPFPPKNPLVTCGLPDPTSCKVEWEQNLDYAVTGYLIMTSAPLAPNPNYDQTDPLENAAALCTGSPLVCSFTRGSLVDTGTTPGQPATPTAGFGDTRVQLTWPAVANATTYDVFVGTVPNSGTLALTVSEPSALVPNLTNGVLYYFSVGAVNQPQFHAAVKAVYGTVSATSVASDIAEATPKRYGNAAPGPGSAEVTSTPQPLVDFPPLENNGGCFIATAAYGSPLAPQVDVLRTFRERYLRPYAPGRVAIRLYESWSPPLADATRSSDAARAVIRIILWPAVGAAWIAVYKPWWVLMILGAAVVSWFVFVGRRGAARA